MCGVAGTISAPFTSLYRNMRTFSWPPCSTGWGCQGSNPLPVMNGGVTVRQALHYLPELLLQDWAKLHTAETFLKYTLHRLPLLPGLGAKFSPFSLGLSFKWTTCTQVLISATACGVPYQDTWTSLWVTVLCTILCPIAQVPHSMVGGGGGGAPATSCLAHMLCAYKLLHGYWVTCIESQSLTWLPLILK